MQPYARLLAFIVIALAFNASAQTPPKIEGPVYTVTYVEALPNHDVTTMLRQYRDNLRSEAANLRAEVVRETARPTRYVLLSAWADQNALDAFSKNAGGAQLRDKFKPLLAAPFDERVHSAFSVASREPIRASAVAVASHVDVPPPMRETVEPMLRSLAEASRKEPGNLRFEVLQQANRINHFTVVEAWADQRAYEAHVAASHTRRFREALGPMLGALYDERLYKPLD